MAKIKSYIHIALLLCIGLALGSAQNGIITTVALLTAYTTVPCGTISKNSPVTGIPPG